MAMNDLLIACSWCTLRIGLDDTGLPRSGICEVVAQGDGLYYGLAASQPNSIWLAARRALVSDAGHPADERGIVMDLSDEPPALAATPDMQLRDLHGIGAYRETVWVACSYDDMIGIYHRFTEEWTWWQPLPLAESAGPDQYHFNTIVFEDELVWLLAHRRGPSWLLAFPIEDALAGRTVAPVEKRVLGEQAHNIWRQPDGELCTCSSIEGLLLGDRGWRLETGGFPRGVAKTDTGWALGISAHKERKDRDFSDAHLQLYDVEWQRYSEFLLPDVGMVLDILAIPSITKLPAVGTLPLAAS